MSWTQTELDVLRRAFAASCAEGLIRGLAGYKAARVRSSFASRDPVCGAPLRRHEAWTDAWAVAAREPPCEPRRPREGIEGRRARSRHRSLGE